MLREAVAKGFADAAKMQTDPALAPLREHPEFKTLLTDLAAKR
jgi:hypothetical protein